ncbi:MAG: restriction endonuclease subunit S [Dehalococcoidia bacterium]|jgi:type I restriction enzyme S subunit
MEDRWDKTTLADVINIKHGFAFQGEFFYDEPRGDILLTPGNFAIGGGFKGDKLKYYDGPTPSEFVLQEGDLLVTMTDLSKSADTLGYPAFVPSRADSRRYLHNQRLGKVIIKDPNCIDIHYLYYIMCTQEYRHEVLASATGTTVKHTSPERIKRFQFLRPSLPEQRAIAQILGTLDDKIELNRRMNETLETMAQALFKSWFVDFDPVHAKDEGRETCLPKRLADLFPDHFEDSEMGEIPAGWGIRSVGDIINRLPVGKKYEQKTVNQTGKVPVLDQGKTGVIGYHDDEPGIIASEEHPIAIFANHTCYMRLIHFPFSAIQNVLPFIGKGVDTIWVFYATYGKQPFTEYKGHWPDFVIHNVVVPTPELMTEFSNLVHPVLRMTWTKENESIILAALRNTMLPKLISGELRIKDAERFIYEVSP